MQNGNFSGPQSEPCHPRRVATNKGTRFSQQAHQVQPQIERSGLADVLLGVLEQQPRSRRLPHFYFQVRRRALDHRLQHMTGSGTNPGHPPQSLHCFMALPPVTVIEQIDPVPKGFASQGIGTIQIRQVREFTVTRFPVGVSFGRAGRMGGLTGKMAVSGKGQFGQTRGQGRKQGAILSFCELIAI